MMNAAFPEIPLVTGELLRTVFGEEKILDAATELRRYQHLMAYYRCAMMEVETKLSVLCEEFSLRHDRSPIHTVKSRLKHPESIRKKLLRYGKPLTFSSLEENIADVAGVRVVCSFIKDVYTIADALLAQDDITLITKKDYIEHPKPNGYRSLHLVVEVPIFLAHEKRRMKVEIQLRTLAMDSFASLEHQLRYKKELPDTPEVGMELARCAVISAELDARMDALRRAVGLDLPDRE